MNCPVCNRNNAFTLSICPSCGAMINDSVREELLAKITPLLKPIPKPVTIDVRGEFTVPEKSASKTNVRIPEEPVGTEGAWSVPEPSAKNPTLVEFHSKNATMPEWRLQLQNAVRQRQARIESSAAPESIQSVGRASLTTSGANALKAEESVAVAAEDAANPTLASALKRIEKSRKTFLPDFPASDRPERTKARPNKTHLYIAAKSNEILPNPHENASPAALSREAKPNDSIRFGVEQTDQGRPIPQPKPASIATSFEQRPMLPFEPRHEVSEPGSERVETAEVEIEMPGIGAETDEEFAEETTEFQEIDDCAPLSMRFNAGLFDLIIGTFASLLIMTPFVAAGTNWFSLTGVIAFVVVSAAIMFLYLTTAVGYYGRTFGMRLFSLEVVDIEGEEYPTVEQAAISSLVYLIGFAFAGIGFLTLFLNDEKRAAHDLVSRTIVVKEF